MRTSTTQPATIATLCIVLKVNEEEIAGVPDVLPLAAQKRLIRSKKRPLSDAIKDVLPINPAYQPMNIPERDSKVLLPGEQLSLQLSFCISSFKN